MALEKYGYFDSAGEDIREYNAADMAAAMRALTSSGVAELANDCLKVSAEGSTMRSLVGYGTAYVLGYWYILEDDGLGVLAFDHATEASLPRIDRIVLRLTLATGDTHAVKLIGTAASTPAVPALTRNAEVYEMALARVPVRAGATQIYAEDIVDERADEDACGVMLPKTLKLSTLWETILANTPTMDVLRWVAQSRSDSEKAQVRTNIGALSAADILNVLNSADTTKALSAAQGKALNDSKASGIKHTATLPTSGWSGTGPYTKAISVADVTADNVVMAGSAPESKAAYDACGAYPSAQGAGTLTYTVTTVPTVAITINVVILNSIA